MVPMRVQTSEVRAFDEACGGHCSVNAHTWPVRATSERCPPEPRFMVVERGCKARAALHVSAEKRIKIKIKIKINTTSKSPQRV
jgi:hypothetical protein